MSSLAPTASPSLSASGGQTAPGYPTIVELLFTVAHADAGLHPREEAFIGQYLDAVLRAAEQSSPGTPDERAQVRAMWIAHLDDLYRRLRSAAATTAEAGSHAIEARAVATFARLPPHDQSTALELVLGLIHADGPATPLELRLFADLSARLAPTPTPAPAPSASTAAARGAAPMLVGPPVWRELVGTAHPLLDPLEQTYSPHPQERQAQLAWDFQLLQQAIATWARQRGGGAGLLAGITDAGQVPTGARILDGHAYVLRPAEPVELVVLGDLHGCYSCLKAALLQSNFIQRAWAHQWDPQRYPDVKLVFLGDYIDRGRFSFDGVLRAVLQLFVSLPDHVFVLRGNHEYFVWLEHQIYSGVHPAEALASITPVAPPELLEQYRQCFELMPTSLLVDRTLFVHGGVPRDDTFEAKYRDLSSLNDPELRFQMLWSDPMPVDHVPVEQQRKNPRFGFGRHQFRAFMEKTGLHTMIRGHEQIDRGFEVIYDLGDRLLLNLFSAGGHDNHDLPPGAPYRAVTPMALTVEYRPGEPPRATPWPIHYQPFTFEPHNGLYRPHPVLEFRYT